MAEHNDWSQRRRASHDAQTNIDAALRLCARHLSAGAIIDAIRAAALAQRLIALETMQSERRRKQELKAAMERNRAEAALAEARKAVASLSETRKPSYEPLTDGQWRTMLERSITAANTSRPAESAIVDSQPVQIPPPDSC
jgi:hypothetical protein